MNGSRMSLKGFCVELSMLMRFCICDNGKYSIKVSTETLNAQKPHPNHFCGVGGVSCIGIIKHDKF